jgi:hypothetical protein
MTTNDESRRFELQNVEAAIARATEQLRGFQPVKARKLADCGFPAFRTQPYGDDLGPGHAPSAGHHLVPCQDRVLSLSDTPI